jgi:hypothetical protein
VLFESQETRSNAGGGGERVLWTAIKAMQGSAPDVVHVVYSGDQGVSKEDIIAKVKSRFAFALEPSTLHFVFLHQRWLIEDSSWPRFTLLGQSLGSIGLAFEGLSAIMPDLYIGRHLTFSLTSLKLESLRRYHGLCFHFPPRRLDRNASRSVRSLPHHQHCNVVTRPEPNLIVHEL